MRRFSWLFLVLGLSGCMSHAGANLFVRGQASATGGASLEVDGEVHGGGTAIALAGAGLGVVESLVAAGRADATLSAQESRERAAIRAEEGRDVRNARTSGGAQVNAGAQAGAGAGNAGASSRANAGGSGSGGANANVNAGASAGVAATAHAEGDASIAEQWGASADLVVNGGGTHLGALAGIGVMVDGQITALAQLDRLAGHAQASANASGGPVLLDAELVPGNGRTDAPRLVVRVRGNDSAPATRPISRVCIAVDRSASMRSDWGSVVDAVRTVAASLPSGVELAVVAYGDDASVVLAPAAGTSPSVAARALENVRPRGGSNIETGLRLAFAQAAGQVDGTLVVLVSDGVPNGGAADAHDLEVLTRDARARTGVTTSVVGLGTDFDAQVLTSVAAAGGGTFRMTPGAGTLAEAIALGLGRAANTVATGIDIRVSLGGGYRARTVVGDSPNALDLRFAVPRLGRGETRTFVIELDRANATGLAPHEAAARITADFHANSATTYTVAQSATAAAAGEQEARLAVLDVKLAEALASASVAVENGQTEAAKQALQGYVQFAGGVQLRGEAAVSARTAVVSRLVSALSTLVPSSSWPERRQVGLAMLTLSMHLGR